MNSHLQQQYMPGGSLSGNHAAFESQLNSRQPSFNFAGAPPSRSVRGVVGRTESSQHVDSANSSGTSNTANDIARAYTPSGEVAPMLGTPIQEGQPSGSGAPTKNARQQNGGASEFVKKLFK